MDIMQIWNAYRKDADPETIFPMYQQCALNATVSGYGDADLLYIASRNAHPEAVGWLLEQGLKPDQASGYGALPLFLLAQKSFSCNYVPRQGDIYRCALALLDAGASTSRRDSYGKLCYHVAAEAGNVEFLRALVERGVRLNRTDENGNTGLHLIVEACRNPLGDLEAVDREIKEKRNEASLPVKQRSPISMEELERRKRAVEETLEDLFRCAVILMDAGVDPEAENDMLETAHKLATRAGAKKIAALLDGSLSPEEEATAQGREKIAAGGMTLHQAVRHNDEEAVRTLVGMGEDINAISEEETFVGLSPLAVACQTCNIPMTSLLLELGAAPSLKNSAGEPPVAALFGPQVKLHGPKNLYRDRLAEQLVALLVQHGFDLDGSLNDQGDCLLGLACASQDVRGSGTNSVAHMVVEALLRTGQTDIDAPNDEGETPLLLACRNQNAYLVEILLKAGADPNRKLLDGFSPLHYAASEGNDAIARALLQGGADGNLRNMDGETPLILAAREGHNDMTALLLQNGADANLVDNLRHSALHYATENGFTEIVEQLLMAGAEV